ncbi:hypothetical protein Q3G72_027483 [Acer saccharum]|nr:hypothetical protein Q3G72_027483 [Acer saccharum]
MVASTSQFHSYTYNIDDPNPNVNRATLPSNSYPGQFATNDDDFEPVLLSQLINNITAAATAISAAPTNTVTTDNFEICRNNSSNSDLGPNNQAGGGANKEDDPLDLDDFSWEECLDFEELLSSSD